MQLTENFSLEELTASSTAIRLGIENSPSDEIADNLRHVAVGLEFIRSLLGNIPLYIDSGYRCEALNTAIHGSKTSAHMQGYAADFVCPEFGKPIDIVKNIASSGLKFDQCIQEGNWVHISFAPTMRQQVMTAHFDSSGNATYSIGINKS